MQLKRTRHCATGLSVTELMVSDALLFGYVPTVVATEDLPREAVFPLSLATTAASTALHRCAKEGYRVTVAVVDRTGILRALMRGDEPVPTRLRVA